MISYSVLSKTRLALLAGALVFGGYGGAMAADTKVSLSGDQEVPPVTTTAKGEGMISISDDMKVTGKVTTTDLESTVAHIHEGAIGKNGPPIITLEKKGDNEWLVPEGAKFTEAQHKTYQSGGLYVNVHSEAHKDGEIRGQLQP